MQPWLHCARTLWVGTRFRIFHHYIFPGTSRAAQWTAQRSDDGAGVLGACSHAPAITRQSVAAMGARIRRFSFLVHPYAERMRAQRERLPTLVGEAVVGGRVWPAAGVTEIG